MSFIKNQVIGQILMARGTTRDSRATSSSPAKQLDALGG